MFGRIVSPHFLGPDELDRYLEKGWFRMGQHIFTCNILRFNNVFYSSIWLRVDLTHYITDHAFRKLQRLNARFDVSIQEASLTPEKEALFAKYKTSISFETADSLHSLLLQDDEPSIFNTFEVCIYDEGRLIGVGYFDLGQKSAAGIVSFYDPDYKKFSLGRYLIYSKIEYCHKLGMFYFYPGYFTPDYSIFDYKLKIATKYIQFFNVKAKQWEPLARFSPEHVLINEYIFQMDFLENSFKRVGVPYSRLKYEYYNSNTIAHLQHLDLFDFPEFFFVHLPLPANYAPVIYWDSIQERFVIARCISCYHDENFFSSLGFYGMHLMKIAEELYATSDPFAIISWLVSSQEIVDGIK